jgi:hypothetical protein
MFNWKGILLASAIVSSSAMAAESVIVRFDLTDSMKKYLKSN